MAQYHKQDLKLVLAHYSRPEIIEQIVSHSHNKEVVGSFGGTGYAKRPDIVQYGNDILEQVKKGVTSFHASEELWLDPLNIETGMRPEQLNELRIGWDLLLDIDGSHIEYAKIASALIVKALLSYGIHNMSVKFSGNKGFHIGIPFESFPSQYNGKPLKDLFPTVPRAIASLLSQDIKQSLQKELLAFQSIDVIQKTVGSAIIFEGVFDPFKAVDIDTIAITSRHLYRQVYSVNEKSGLVSVPINPKKILQFEREMVPMVNCPISKFSWLDRTKSVPGEASRLLLQAMDAYAQVVMRQEEEALKKKMVREQRAKEFEPLTEKIPEELFPPTIQALLEPLKDGKKRALFILTNFLRSVGYSAPETIARLDKWNQKHAEPLRASYFEGQMRYVTQDKDPVMPPNYDNDAYSIVSVEQDELEKKVKNPVAVAKIRYETYLEDKKKQERQAKRDAKKKAKEDIQNSEK